MIMRYFYAIILGLLMAASFWLLGFLWFITLIPSQHQLPANYQTEAIVVLTGGKGRVEQGIELLRENKAKWLFVSGVHPDTAKPDIFANFRRLHPADYQRLQSRIELGKNALDTRGNAVETARWVAKKKFSKIRLVTANYHMPRSLLEFSRTLPQVTIIPAPVFTDHFGTGEWWKDKPSLMLVVSEYHKYLASMTYGLVEK